VLFITYIWAYFLNNNFFSVNINLFGEANTELIFLTGVIIAIVYGLYLHYRDFDEQSTEITEDNVEYEILKILYDNSMDIRTVTQKLGISVEVVQPCVEKLVKYGLIHLASDDTLQIKENGIEYIEYLMPEDHITGDISSNEK